MKASPLATQEPKSKLNERKILGILSAEKDGAVGFSSSGKSSDTLSSERQRALEYIRGKMDDVPALANRSKAVDSHIADTIETVLPDLIEIFMEEDVVSFTPMDDTDVETAQEETDFIEHVLFQLNTGWLDMYSAFKDALSVKLGVWKFWWQDAEDVETKEGSEAQLAAMPGVELVQGDDGQVSGEIVTEKGKVCFKAVAPEDFAAADDTVRLADTFYCVERSRPRIQELIEQGYDKDKVMSFEESKHDDDERDARDTVDETEDIGRDSSNILRKVTVHEHWIKTDFDDTGVKTWKVLTNADESVMLDASEMTGIDYASITPFINPHRLYGLSMADKTMEIQKIKTSLLRMMLDSGYFALNQRVEIADDGSNEFTQSDYLRNEPGMFVRVDKTGTVNPIQAGQLGFDVQSAIEHASVMGEMRSGVIRNAQGLDSDALHDTATGQQSQLTMSQKRTRLIARCFAETGFKDLCLGVHRLYRNHAKGPVNVYLGGKTRTVDPTQWPDRSEMEIQIGSGGKAEAQAAIMQIFELMERIGEAQGGPSGPIVDFEGIYKLLGRLTSLMPVVGLSDVFKDPAEQPPQPPQPDPEMEKIKAEAQLKEREMQAKFQEKQAEMAMNKDAKQIEFEMKGQEIEMSNQLKREEAAVKNQIAREDATEKRQLERDKAIAQQAHADRQFEREIVIQDREFAHRVAMDEKKAAEDVKMKKNRPGGDLDK